MRSERKVLVLFPGALGDFVCFLPALARLNEKSERLDLLGRKDFEDIVPPSVQTRSLERYEVSRLFVPRAHPDDQLIRFFGSYDAVYSWTGKNRPEFVDHLYRLTHGRARIFPFRPSLKGIHQMEYYLDCLGEKSTGDLFAVIPLKKEALEWSLSFIHEKGLEGKAVLALSPGSGAREKNWPLDNFRFVSDWWKKETGGETLLLLGPAEEERGGYQDFSRCSVAVRGQPLGRVAALLARSNLYLGNDSGVTHLAAALGMETIALFGPSDPHEWSPRGKAVTVITRNVECSPCVEPVRKACFHRKCLTTLAPVEVIRKIRQVWRSTPCLTNGEINIKGVFC